MVQVTAKPNKNELKVWEKVRIIAGEGSAAGVFEARVEDFVPEGIVVTYPELISGGVLLREGLTVRVQVTREDAAYQFNSVVRSHDSGPSGRRVIMTSPARLQRIQRRQFARIDISSQVSYARFRTRSDWENWPEGMKWMHTRSVDLSGGGILIKVKEKVGKDSLLVLKVDLFTELELPSAIIGVCVRECVKEQSLCAGVRYLLAPELQRHMDRKTLRRIPKELKEFNAHAQDRLVMHLFHKQIELRQKGLI